MIQSTRRGHAWVVVVLAAELLIAGWWRWSWTVAPIQTPFDYGTGHVVVVSENWRIHGAVRRHFLPVMSIDPQLPEWPYRVELSQDYTSAPPLAFILHYVVMRALPRIEPVLLGKLLAQSLIAASVLASALFLTDVFGDLATLTGLTFAIWSVPFLLWFANGYFAVNVGLAAQLVLVSWCGAIAARSLRPPGSDPPARPLVHGAIGAGLAFVGAFSDYMPLFANGIAAAGLFALAMANRPAARRLAIASAGGVLAGSAVAGAATLGLYSAELGARRYLDAITLRTAQRTGHAAISTHLDVIRRQMLTAWPPEVLVPLAAIACGVVAWTIVAIVRRRRSADAAVVLITLAAAAGPSLVFHYRAVNYVAIHWWFAGTWIIGWTMVVCAFIALMERTRVLLWLGVAAIAAVTTASVRFTRAQAAVEPQRAESVQLYREIGAALPYDGLPIVITDVTIEWPGLFEDFPFATAYLRRPVLLREPAGVIRLPRVSEMYEGHPLEMGGEDVAEPLLRRGGDVYVAYDPDAHGCRATPVPLPSTHTPIAMALCRAPAQVLVQNPGSVLGPLSPGYPCAAPPDPPGDPRIVANHGGTVVVSWSPSATKRSSYILEAGRARGRADALTADVGRSTTFTASQVQPGTYYVRVRGRNVCGTGAASSEVVVEVE